MANIFNSVKIKLQRKNKFNLSFASRLTTEFGRLTPILCEEVLPNDTFKIRTAIRAQFAPMKFPVMQKFTAYIHYFFVARRLVMDDWETFITRGEDGITEVPYPVVAITNDFAGVADSGYKGLETSGSFEFFGASSLWDYLGFPTIQDITDVPTDEDLTNCHDFDILPFRAYQLIYNQWYRDQTLTPEVELNTDVVGYLNQHLQDSEILDCMKLRHRAWRKDYFTSALPDPQRGPDVTLPLLGDMDIKFKDEPGHGPAYLIDPLTGKPITEGEVPNVNMRGYDISPSEEYSRHVMALGSNTTTSPTGIAPVNVDNSEALYGDGSTMRSATINEVRRAFAVQRWYELAARAGNRYIEQILAHFGIRSSDARLQRAEYIGGAAIPVNIGDILQTSESNPDGTPLGTPAGVGQAAGVASLKYRRGFTSEEHGYIIGILSVIPEASYPQGMPRKFSRRDTFDFAWPLLANIGEQEIKRKELFYDFLNAPEDYNEQGFGYAPRYSEYKFGSGQVHGDFRTSLRDFHDARFFADDNKPRLNTEFVEVNTDNDGDDGLNRIFAVTDSSMADHLWVSLYNDIKVRRVLPKYGTPI